MCAGTSFGQSAGAIDHTGEQRIETLVKGEFAAAHGDIARTGKTTCRRIEIREIDPALSWKKNAIHPRLRQAAG